MMELIKLPFSTFLIVVSVLTGVLISNFNSTYFFGDFFEAESSVWCHKGLNKTNLCKFKNICYDSYFQTFLFFLGKGTKIRGLRHYNELQEIQLSSISVHNRFYANISMIDVSGHQIKKNVIIEPKALLFARFKPDNIMHCVHDDLFPVFLTLESLCSGDKNCMESYTLIFHDHHPPGPFSHLYNLFSKKTPVLLNKLYSNSEVLLCFHELITGLVQDSIFYDYGFKRPQGPVKPPNLRQNDILQFKSFIQEKLNLNEDDDCAGEIILISRKKNRKILNVDEIREMITTTLQELKRNNTVKIVYLDLYLNDTVALIKLISQAKILVGMHGAEMIFSLFMKPKSIVFELFPFGIQPEVVSFIKTVSEIEGSTLTYFSWRNQHKNSSVPHEDAHPSLGGIRHLNKVTQERIKNTYQVPPVECCNNPLFLYHMYQDTHVSGEFKQFFVDSISKQHGYQNLDSGHAIKKWFYPNIVFNASCNFHMSKNLLHIKWLPPFNIININELKYSLYVRDKGNNFQKEIVTDLLNVSVAIPEVVGNGAKFQVWIAVQDNNSKSRDLFLECH